MQRKLRVSQVVIQPILVWDDGEELIPGPELQAVTLPLSEVAMFASSLPAEVAALNKKLVEDKHK